MVLKGTPVSPGIAIGKLYCYQPVHIEVSEGFCGAGEAEAQIARFEEVKGEAAKEIEAIRAALEALGDPEKAKIFTAHLDILDDVAITEEILQGIQEENWTGDWAIQKIYAKFERMIRKAKDPLIRERAADFDDVRKRLIRRWYGVQEKGLGALTEPVIVAARDLLPSDTASLDRKKVLAILTEVGGTTSHSAIIARSYEIPAILGIPDLMSQVRQDQSAAVDAGAGELILEPAPDTVKAYELKREEFRREAAETREFLGAEARTACGIRIDIGLNIGGADEQELAGEAVTDLVGLFRTEFLYMGRDSLPDEDEQFAVYKKVLQRYGGRPVTLRTLDIGGDKTLSSMNLPREDNPVLGNRALRLCFTYPEVFKTQLRAALRASVFGSLWLMLPMVGSIDDIRRATAFITEVKDELDAEGAAYDPHFKTGIMVEIPSIAVVADLAAKEVDFASIGTNDLCQYLTAVDRMNPRTAQYYQPYHPAMFRLIGNVVEQFNRAGKPICVCGEMGGDALAAPVLVGLGMRKLSMGLASVARIKRLLSSLTVEKAEQLAAAVINLSTAPEVEHYLRTNLRNETRQGA
ncbi:MAG: phosphoenolpyruvate--protein phosphotransferase [Spirochaetaceae bacterium]|jgi:phosphotransferase system enzyme I (PtsI)|nr:phosphoenolpyruvate--protein phosphotransferase [Spirochaetaceae bacterium]